jgi:ABC-type Fe3+ transport system substrate-binding protein
MKSKNQGRGPRWDLKVWMFVASLIWMPSTTWAQSWEQVLTAAKSEGKVVVAISPSAELRKGIEEKFQKGHGIQVELSPGDGGRQVRKIFDEYKAGLRNFDLMIGGTGSTLDLMDYGLLMPVAPYLILPEVKEVKHWWGGHMYADKTNQFVYAPLAYVTESVWYNKSLVKPGEIRSYDDLLQPKWKGKIGLHDPRVSGSGFGAWSFIWLVKGEGYLTKLVQQEPLIMPERRQIAEAVARGRIHIGIGAAYFSYLPFIKAGLPIETLILEEGSQGSYGSGNIAIIKNHPHPNATKVFVNWMLSKEGQDVFGRAMGQATRRLDVDTKWMQETGVAGAKDTLSVEKFKKIELGSQERRDEVRDPAQNLANRLLK